ncbi:T9SS type A sorting domain-containing protein [Chryseobacterium tructae]|uniref:T9SS-dependent choice-of-anchor J family protein n=1 Tax=Chryseobacterium tructae TaxID=1037380 RepID=A0ABV7XW50_9FLAO|nr:T9SS type A sorting domain-containing protein [Chryseobacterium tructae]MDN3692949.1 T9SS type A sorting domain-containing protein [Chryseobacterium tructae]
MKKTLLFIAGISILLCSISLLRAQTNIFEETFESVTPNDIPAGWIRENRDNDMLTWVVEDGASETDPIGYSGKVVLVASTADSSDNLLGTSAINLPGGNSYTLSFKIGTFTVSGLYNADNHYAVYVLPENSSFTGTETPVLEEDITIGDIAVTKTVDLSGYAGQNVKIYFRQFINSQGTRALLLDTVKVLQGVLGVSEAAFSSQLGIYPNPTSDYIYIKSKSLINKVKVFDMNGKALPVNSDEHKIDVRMLLPGAYIVNIESGGRKSSHKFVKK